MLILWKMIYNIAQYFENKAPIKNQPPYDPKIYEFVFSTLLKHRNFIPLYVDELFSISIDNEKKFTPNQQFTSQ